MGNLPIFKNNSDKEKVYSKQNECLCMYSNVVVFSLSLYECLYKAMIKFCLTYQNNQVYFLKKRLFAYSVH